MAESNKAVFRIVINGSIDAIFRELTKTDSPQGAVFNSMLTTRGLAPGNRMQMRTVSGGHTIVEGQVVEYEPPRRFAHTHRFTQHDDPVCKVVYDLKAENEARFGADTGGSGQAVLTGAQKAILAVFALAFVVMIYGVIPWSDLGIPFPTWWWWFPEMTASFLLFAIIIGLIGRLSEGELTTSFIDGARDLLGVALIIGIARGITVIMNNGQITDTVLNWAEQAVGDASKTAFAIVMFALFLPLSFLIPSSSGLANVATPIMAPLASFANVPASLVVTAYQSASGIMNLFIPTSAVVMGGLAIARVPYGTYLRWVWPLLALLVGLTIVALAVGAAVS